MPSTEDVARNAVEQPAWLRQLAHDLRGPLSPLQTSISLLRSGRLSEAQQTELLDTMQRQLRVLVQTIDDTGDLLAQRNPALAPMDVASLLDMVSVRTRLHFQEAGLHFEVQAPDSPLVVNCDARDLARLLGHLALRLGEMSGRGARVVASARRDGGRLDLQLSVEGADPAELAAVAQRLLQPDPAGVTDAILQRILQRHDARLRARAPEAALLLSLPAAAEV